MEQNNGKILVVYYSHSGNTETIARLIGQESGGVLAEIRPQAAYPQDYNTVVAQAKGEIQRGFLPALAPDAVPDPAEYDVVLIGTPNWWSTVAPPIATFLTENDLNGKTVAPFCTHGGGGVGHIEQDIQRLCPHATVRRAFETYGDGGTGARAKVLTWLKEIGLKA